MSSVKTGALLNLVRVHLDENGVDRTGKLWPPGPPVWHYDGEGRSSHHGYVRAWTRTLAKKIRRDIRDPRATFYNGL